MDREALAETVTNEVLRRLRSTAPASEGIAVGGAWPGWQNFAPGLHAGEQKCALIVQLAPWSALRLAEGQAASAEEEFLLEMLLLGRSVYVTPQALTYRRYQKTAPPALYRRYAAGEKALFAMGVRPLAARDEHPPAVRTLLTASDVEALLAQGETILHVKEGSIITPLAMDALKAAQITVLRGEKEAKPWS